MREGHHGHAEDCVGPKEPAHHDYAGDGGENDGTENAGAPASDDLFNDEKHGGDGRIKGRGETGCRTDRSEQAKLLTREFEPATERRGKGGADLERGILGAEG